MKTFANLCLLTILFLCQNIAAAAEDLAARVIVLANSEDPGSMRIARHYAEARSVPAENASIRCTTRA